MRQSSSVGGLIALALIVSFVVVTPSNSAAEGEEAAAYRVPLFRYVVPDQPPPDLQGLGPVRFVADGDFPPFSYRDARGALAGFNVSLADAVCRELRLSCEFAVKPFADMRAQIEGGASDAILAGLKVTPADAETLDFTRPFYRALARFAVRGQFKLKEPYVRNLAGKRIGVMAGSLHEAWLERVFSRSTIIPFDGQAEAFEALRTGKIDALFDDAVRLMYWITGPGARGCCRLADGAFIDEATFSPPMVIAVKRGNARLREALDWGLDRLQENGTYADIFRRYFPLSPW
jgi:polar amino acid transport system substrate-binding protein